MQATEIIFSFRRKKKLLFQIKNAPILLNT